MSDIFVGDNDHGDALPEPTCRSCGVAWVDHTGIMGVCVDNKALREDLKDSLESHDEMRLEIAQLTKERDEARREICERREYQWYNPQLTAVCRGWDCYKEKTP